MAVGGNGDAEEEVVGVEARGGGRGDGFDGVGSVVLSGKGC